MVNHDTLRDVVAEIMGTSFRASRGFGAQDDFKSGDTANGRIWIDFRIDGRSIHFGRIARLQRRLHTEDIEVEVCIDTEHVRQPGDYSDPGPDDHVKYEVRNASWDK